MDRWQGGAGFPVAETTGPGTEKEQPQTGRSTGEQLKESPREQGKNQPWTENSARVTTTQTWPSAVPSISPVIECCFRRTNRIFRAGPGTQASWRQGKSSLGWIRKEVKPEIWASDLHPPPCPGPQQQTQKDPWQRTTKGQIYMKHGGGGYATGSRQGWEEGRGGC